MRIDSGTSYLYPSQYAQAANSQRSAATFSSTTVTENQANGTRQLDFTSMTRQEMRDWVNSQIRSGEMSLDDSSPFMAMSMKIPLDGDLSGELSAASDSTRYDFTQKVRDGIQGALSRHDETTLNMLKSAMQIIQQQQGKTIGIDTRA